MATAATLDEICDHFEAEWKSGRRLGFSRLLKKVGAEDRPQLARELILIDVEYRRRNSEEVDPQDYKGFGQGGMKLVARAIRELENVGAVAALSRLKKPATEPSSATDETVVQTGSKTLAEEEDQAPDTDYRSLRNAPDPSANTFGRFEIVGELGHGSFGRVLKAWDPHLERHVALKTPSFDHSEQKQVARFLGEAKSAGRLKHQNIVSVLESGQIDQQHYIASELVEGKSMGDWLDDGRPAVRQAVEIAVQLADALEYAHSEGIVHRDIKPDNIMIDLSDRPYIMDFGLAKRSDDDQHMTTEGALLGTPAYMSPEQARGETSLVGPASDQYSLAVVLYHLLCGQPPFDGPAHKVVLDVAAGNVPSVRSHNRRVNRELEGILKTAMSGQVDDRFASCEQFRDELRKWCENHRPKRRSAQRTKASSTSFQRPLMIGLLSVVAVCLIGFIGWGSWQLMYPGDLSEAQANSNPETTPATNPASNEEANAGRFPGTYRLDSYSAIVAYTEQMTGTRIVQRNIGNRIVQEQIPYTYTVKKTRKEFRTADSTTGVFPDAMLAVEDGAVQLQVASLSNPPVINGGINSLEFTIDQMPNPSQSGTSKFLAIQGAVFEYLPQQQTYTVSVPFQVTEQVPVEVDGEVTNRTVTKTVMRQEQRVRTVMNAGGIMPNGTIHVSLPAKVSIVPTLEGLEYQFTNLDGVILNMRSVSNITAGAELSELPEQTFTSQKAAPPEPAPAPPSAPAQQARTRQ